MHNIGEEVSAVMNNDVAVPLSRRRSRVDGIWMVTGLCTTYVCRITSRQHEGSSYPGNAPSIFEGLASTIATMRALMCLSFHYHSAPPEMVMRALGLHSNVSISDNGKCSMLFLRQSVHSKQ